MTSNEYPAEIINSLSENITAHVLNASHSEIPATTAVGVSAKKNHPRMP